MKNKNLHGVVIIGGHIQGLGIARIFGRNGIATILLDKTKVNLTRHSKYCSKMYLYKEEQLLEQLRNLGRQGAYTNWLLMPTNDAHVEVLSKNKAELSKYFKVSTVDIEVLNYFFNKRNTYKLAEKLQIEIPQTWMPDDWNELDNMDLVYPCIIKPAVMHTFYSKTKKKVFVCNKKQELEENYRKAIQIIPKEEIIVQDIIPGSSENQYSACFMFDGEKALVSLVARRVRQHPPDFGNATTYAETVENLVILADAKKILKAVNFIGVCEVEFKYDKRDGLYKFLEVNPRTWKWHSIAEKSESPILMSLYNYVYNKKIIECNEYKNATFRHLATDIPTMLKMKVLGVKYPKIKKNTKYAVWDSKDIAPAFFEMLYLPYLILKR